MPSNGHRFLIGIIVIGVVATSAACADPTPAAAPAATTSTSSSAPAPSPSSTASEVTAAPPSAPSSDDRGSAPADPFEHLVAAVQAQIARHWPNMGPVWPGIDYSRHLLLLFRLGGDGEVADAWLAGPTDLRRLEPGEYRHVIIPEPGGYNAVDFDGAPSVAMTVDIDRGPDAGDGTITYRIATHELVHFYYQDEMSQFSEGGRLQSFPADSQPRLYRAMTYLNLIRAYEDPAAMNDHLAAARYWQDRWRTEYPDERDGIADTDIAEGTARYVEMLGMIAGDDLSGAERDQRLGELIPRTDEFVAAEAESYELGFVAGLLLDRTTPGWKDGFFTRNTPLVDELLADITPVPQEADPALQRQAAASTEEFNRYAEAQLADLLTARSDLSIPLLKVKVSDMSASMAVAGAVLLDDQEVNIGVTTSYRAGGGEIRLNETAARFDFADDGEMTVAVPLTMPHTLTDGVLSATSDRLVVDDVAVTTTEQDGRTVYEVTTG